MDAHGNGADDAPEYTRAPTVEDLKAICGWLNDAGARYAVVGGMAVNHFGVARATFDRRLGTPIPYASPAVLIRMKQTVRAKDREDCRELRRLHDL